MAVNDDLSGAPPARARRRRHGLTAPVVLITLGILLLLDQTVPHWGFERTWPVLLIEFGVLLLVEAFSPPAPPEGPRI